MPQYGQHRFGRFQYGRYLLSGGGGDSVSIGPHIQYRVRTINSMGAYSDFLVMHRDRVSIPSIERVTTRIRSDKTEWLYAMNESIQGRETVKVRIRSISPEGIPSEWVFGDKGELK